VAAMPEAETELIMQLRRERSVLPVGQARAA